MSKTALISGISSGIGQAVKHRLEADGWKVIGLARHLPLNDLGYEVDLSILGEVEPVATRAGEEYGPIDAFVHIAGVWHNGESVLAGKKLHEFSTDEIARTLNVGLISAMILTARLKPFMSPSANLLYISGLFEDNGANWLPYYTSKRGLEDFIKGLSEEYPEYQVHAVAPGATATDSLQKFRPELVEKAQSPETVAKTVQDLLESRLGADSGLVVSVDQGEHHVAFHG